MFYGLFRTPLYAAVFCAAIIAGCQSNHSDNEFVQKRCSSRTTPVSSVQGNGAVSPMLDREVTIRGIVTLVQSNHGLYLEEPGSDTDTQTSNAIFIRSPEIPNGVESGSLISARGKVSEIGKERQSLTALTDVDELILCESNQTLPLTDIKLPLGGPAFETLEGMRIQADGPLVATDVYQFGRGNFTLSGNGLQYAPTEVMAPGPKAMDQIALNKTFALPVMMPEDMGFPKLLVSGTSIDQITGVLAHDDRGLRVSLQSISTFSSSGFAPPLAAGTGALRIVGMNLHNYFNGDGKGSGFPTPRGAKTAEGFRHQRDRIGAAIRILDPHVLAVMELENDGFETDSAAQDYIQLANKATNKSWAVTRPASDNTGTDKITVGLFYRSDKLKAIGSAQTLTGPEFKFSRQPQAQLFQYKPDGEKILVVITT